MPSLNSNVLGFSIVNSLMAMAGVSGVYMLVGIQQLRVHDILDESVVKVGLEANDKEECFEEMIDLLVRAGRLSDRAGALQAIRDREEKVSTGIGKGIAVPHSKHRSIETLTMALGVSAKGIEFDAVDDRPVHVVFLLLARADEPGPHVQALAEIGRLVQTAGFYRKLVAATSAKQALAIIGEEE